MSHLVGHSRGRVRYAKVTLSPVPECWPWGVPWLLRPTVIDPEHTEPVTGEVESPQVIRGLGVPAPETR